MAELAPELLRWLSTVLAPKYHSANRAYTDTATLLHHYRGLSPKTDVYSKYSPLPSYDDGRSDLLLCIHGTLPVAFRGATYNIPLNIWVPHQYPNTPPTVMVVPGKNMGIRPTNHVDTNGRCYHPYLAYWSQNPDKSTLIDLCGQLKDVFGKEPPLYSKQPVAQPPPPPQNQPIQSIATPPPRPPLPQEIESQRARSNPVPQQQPADQATPPPPPPPKAEPRHQSPAAYSYTTTPHLFTPRNQSAPQPVASPPLHPPPQNNINNHNQGPPERPALPQKLPREEPRPAYPIPSPAYQQTPPQPPPVPPLPSPIRNSTIGSPGPRSPPPPPHSPYHQQHHITPPPPLPVHPQHGWHPQQQSPPPPPSQVHRLSGQYEPLNRFPTVNQPQQRPISIHGYPPQQLSSAGPSNLNPTTTKLPQRSQSQRKPFNILDADDDNASSLLPTPATSKLAVPPPLPPNPEKDRLINEIAKILQQKADAASAKTMASLEQTTSQAEAMAKTEAYMERERIELTRINDVCEKDQRILNERIGMADELIREVRDREAPNIDAVVVAPTVVHNQLYELVTDDMAIEDTIYVLGKALDKERITLDVFLKHTRALAREQFMKRALVKKISRQIGMT
ncbi:hypothetical protein TWF102_007535 [Orbilia oligospora]|uniref:UEV domain-containing protein n=1 Tax=Orbilia oligospora TaxID=2813651 RepID=A0A7C8NNR6_ORBOL|nr:hypothetical protein TWF103_001690 [Orbilia oligospora]KAF3094410.1 hypothetical protein TWF102_007535 [Orbilia oligospora]KAF3120275.1 hypothetical protein TWF594_003941 [Orbilia oligospora]KAF3139798.1 hypothetical protein TWF703_003376 [Orbilia oligospora]